MQVDFYNLGDIEEKKLFYAVIVAQYEGEWLFVQQKDRKTWEIPAGRKEIGESIFQTAQRELYEETGALDYELKEVCDYSVTSSDVRYGRLFMAKIKELGPLPISEISRILFLDKLPSELTYPEIQPLLLQQVMRSVEEIVPASEENVDAWVHLGVLLWPNCSLVKLRELFFGNLTI